MLTTARSVNAALEQQTLDVPQRQGEADVHKDHEADHLGRRIEAAKRASWLSGAWHRSPLAHPGYRPVHSL